MFCFFLFFLWRAQTFPLHFGIRVGPWKHRVAKRWEGTAVPGDAAGGAQPLSEIRPPRAEPKQPHRGFTFRAAPAPLPTLQLAAGDASHGQKLRVEREDVGATAPLAPFSSPAAHPGQTEPGPCDAAAAADPKFPSPRPHSPTAPDSEVQGWGSASVPAAGSLTPLGPQNAAGMGLILGHDWRQLVVWAAGAGGEAGRGRVEAPCPQQGAAPEVQGGTRPPPGALSHGAG